MERAEAARVLIVGCGQLGSRHLQAVATVPKVREVEVVDPRPEALAMGRARLDEVPDRNRAITYRWLSSLEDAGPRGELCIVATQADVRCDVVRAVAQRLGYAHFLLEKLVAQSVDEYEELLVFAASHELSVWVNCKTRAHVSHKRVKAHLDFEEPLVFNVVGGNHGLANNGVHMADLFVFYDGASRIEPVGSCIEPTVSQTKRGTFDLSGTLHGCSAKGSQCFLSFAGHHDGPIHYAVVSPRYRALFDDMMKWFYESTPETGWAWRSVPMEANFNVSHMTRTFAAEILQFGRCELPTLQECFPAHAYILSALAPHFQALLGSSSTRCPVT